MAIRTLLVAERIVLWLVGRVCAVYVWDGPVWYRALHLLRTDLVLLLPLFGSIYLLFNMIRLGETGASPQLRYRSVTPTFYITYPALPVSAKFNSTRRLPTATGYPFLMSVILC